MIHILRTYVSKHQTAADIAASAPPVTVAGMSFVGYPIQDWVQVIALIWLVLQIGYFVYAKCKKDPK